MDRIEVKITKLVPGGQGLAELPDGKKVFVWNALPGEVVVLRLIRQKRSYAEAIAEEIIVPAPERIEPRETNYLATSPWQIMSFAAENDFKRGLVQDMFRQEKVNLPAVKPVWHDDRQWHYRNKMEYAFWGDEEGLHLALHERGSHSKQRLTGCVLALPAVDRAAEVVRRQLEALGVMARDLKTILVRCNQNGSAVAALFVKTKQFPKLLLPPELQGLVVYYSNPKSPASIATEQLQRFGNILLTDTLLGRSFSYDVAAFFQVNVPVFEQALAIIKAQVSPTAAVTDMYGGVGSIGLSLECNDIKIVELDAAATRLARFNAHHTPGVEVMTLPSEAALTTIDHDRTVIFDPPRAGLHDRIITRICEQLPRNIIYLSCNPITQARDLAKLQDHYQLSNFSVYNFFPRTPHIESLAVLKLQ